MELFERTAPLPALRARLLWLFARLPAHLSRLPVLLVTTSFAVNSVVATRVADTRRPSGVD